MSDWIQCKSGFIVADVIRWHEPIWDNAKRGKNAKPKKIGERSVTAEVKKENPVEGWVWFSVLECESKPLTKKPVETYKAGAEIKRKRATIERNGFDRLPWSDETARRVLEQERQSHKPNE